MAETTNSFKRRRVPLYPGFPELARSDVSIYPTYSQLELTYDVVCRHRYHFAKIRQHKQFKKELHSFEMLQNKALSGILMAEDEAVKPEKKRRIQLYPGFPELARSDVSIYPTYSKLKLSYVVVCRHRYHYSKVAQRKQFMKELHSFERLQPNALDGVRVHREFSQGILSHKIPPRRYVNRLSKEIFTPKQRMRLEDIISGRIDD